MLYGIEGELKIHTPSDIFLLNQELWDVAFDRMPGHEVKFLLGLALINDANRKIFSGWHCVAVISDIVNGNPDRVGEIEEALLAGLQVFPDYLAQEFAGKIADKFGELPPHEDNLKRQQLQQIREVLSAYAAPVTDPYRLL